MNKRSVYVHVPFCEAKCGYCDFLSFAGRAHLSEAYVESLIGEIRATEHLEGTSLASIFLGGGTPTTLSSSAIASIVEAISRKAKILSTTEVSVEANPGGKLDVGYFSVLKKGGVNRISIGLQAVQPSILKRLGRIHSYRDFESTLNAATAAGFSNINADIMFALPDQSLEDLRESIDCVTELGIPHISAYSLIVEEETPFYALREKGRLNLPSEDTDIDMYHFVIKTLAAKGYEQYEISNFAKPGYECIHNLITWNRRDYIGFGIGAHSMADNVRWRNIESIDEYIAKNEKTLDRWELSIEEQMQETMFIGLRLTRGISTSSFLRQFGESIDNRFGAEIRKHMKLGLLELSGGNLRLTPKGMDLSNIVLADFL